MLTILFTSILNPIIHINFTIKRHLNTIKISELKKAYDEGKYEGHLEVSMKSDGNDTVI